VAAPLQEVSEAWGGSGAVGGLRCAAQAPSAALGWTPASTTPPPLLTNFDLPHLLHRLRRESTTPQNFHPLPTGVPPLRAATMCQTFKPNQRIKARGPGVVSLPCADCSTVGLVRVWSALQTWPAAVHGVPVTPSLQTAVLPAATDDGTAVECAAVLLPYKPPGGSASREGPRVGGAGPPGDYYGVLAMPRGQLSDDGGNAGGGDRSLVTANGGSVPYGHALAACRHALLAQLPGPAAATEGGAEGGVWRWDARKEVKLHLPRQGRQPTCNTRLLYTGRRPAAMPRRAAACASACRHLVWAGGPAVSPAFCCLLSAAPHHPLWFRFEVEFSASLNNSLSALGLHKPFEGGDLTGVRCCHCHAALPHPTLPCAAVAPVRLVSAHSVQLGSCLCGLPHHHRHTHSNKPKGQQPFVCPSPVRGPPAAHLS
jgi:hypothetical protein